MSEIFDKSDDKMEAVSGTWDGPLIVAMYYQFAGRDFSSNAKHFLNQCDKYDMSCSVLRVDKSEVPDELEANNKPQSKRRKYNKLIPFVIQDFLCEREQSVLYMHVDSEILKCPPASCFNKDVMVSIGHDRQKRCWHILGSPVYFRPSDTAYEFLDIWKQKCVNSDGAEHASLKRTYEKYHENSEVAAFDVIMSSRSKDDEPYIYF